MTKQLVTTAFFIIIAFNITNCQEFKYKDCKNNFTRKDYKELTTKPKYSPIIAGVSTFMFIPVGYFYVDEPLRGLCLWGGSILSATTTLYGMVILLSTSQHVYYNAPNIGSYLMYGGLLLYNAICIYSVFDVIKIAKIKNVAFANKNNISINIMPNIFPTNNTFNSIAYGLTLSINL